MAGPGIAISVVGEQAGVERMLDALDTALNPVAIAAFLGAVVDPHIRDTASERFASEGDAAVGGTWKPLAEATQNIRDQMGYGAGHPINRREGELEAYVTNTTGNVTIHPFGATLTYPTNYPGGELGDKLTHAQLGGVSSSGKQFPARPVYGLGASDLTFVLLALAQHVQRSGSAVI